MNEKAVIIKVKGLEKKYPGSDALAINQLDMEISKGEIFGLLGPNGAGKTTTISILCGLMPATEGTVVIDGLSLPSDKDRIKKLIGVVPQDIALYPTLTATENLMFFGQMAGVNTKTLRPRVAEYLKRFGLFERRNDRVGNFSGGMKRRVNLIAGLLHQPEILFLDEPTVGVDVHSRHMILESLNEFNRGGTTIVYTSHHLNEAENLCTRIGVIDHGHLIALGAPKSLMDEHSLSSLEELFLHLTGRHLRD